MKLKPIQDIETYSRRRAVNAIIYCIIIAVLVFVGLSMRLIAPESEYVTETGLKAYRMFTVESNVVVAVCALLCIPYEIDGLRNRDYHMPRWIICTLYAGTNVVAMTFLVALTILSPAAGFVYIMLYDSSLFMHTVCPILAILLFIQIANDHFISFKMVFISLAPILVYAIVYIFMCFVLGAENGGWPDHYRFNTYIPWPCTMVIMFGIAFGIAVLLRLGHNKVHALQKARYRAYYLGLDYPDIESAVAALARKDREKDPGVNDVSVPRRVIRILNEKYHSEKSMAELCGVYLENYLE